MAKIWRALVADDHEDSTEMMKIKFERAGFEVLTAFNGEQAVGAFEGSVRAGREVDIAVLDYEMPRMKGDVVARKINELATKFGIEPPQVLIYTGTTDPTLLMRLNTARLGVVLLKPFGLEQLERFLGWVGTQRENGTERNTDHRTALEFNYIAAHRFAC